VINSSLAVHFDKYLKQYRTALNYIDSLCRVVYYASFIHWCPVKMASVKMASVKMASVKMTSVKMASVKMAQVIKAQMASK